jgi:cholesterol transport system auxiliary component
MRVSRSIAGAALAALVLGACSSTPQPGVERYDFGVAASDAAVPRPDALPGALDLRVGAPPWLATGAVEYRLAYDDESRVRSYANSRWVDAPAALLAQRLRERLAASFTSGSRAGDAVPAGYRLQVELEEFSQVFDTPAQSHGVLRASATFEDVHDHRMLAQRAFEVQRPARSADAAGAVHAMQAAVDEFAGQLLDWMRASAASAGRTP